MLDNIHLEEVGLIERLIEDDWKDTYRDEPFLYHRSLLNMLIQTALLMAERRPYDPNAPDVFYRDNFNISVVKLKKAFPCSMLLELLSQPDGFLSVS